MQKGYVYLCKAYRRINPLAGKCDILIDRGASPSKVVSRTPLNVKHFKEPCNRMTPLDAFLRSKLTFRDMWGNQSQWPWIKQIPFAQLPSSWWFGLVALRLGVVSIHPLQKLGVQIRPSKPPIGRRQVLLGSHKTTLSCGRSEPIRLSGSFG